MNGSHCKHACRSKAPPTPNYAPLADNYPKTPSISSSVNIQIKLQPYKNCITIYNSYFRSMTLIHTCFSYCGRDCVLSPQTSSSCHLRNNTHKFSPSYSSNSNNWVGNNSCTVTFLNPGRPTLSCNPTTSMAAPSMPRSSNTSGPTQYAYGHIATSTCTIPPCNMTKPASKPQYAKFSMTLNNIQPLTDSSDNKPQSPS